jgi:hypothetical protein
MFELLGSEMPLPLKFFVAFATVLVLIGLTAWLVRRFGANRLGGGNARGRQPRLAVIDAATVDGRRRLVLIRRDNVEHLLMIGGPTDVVVEPNIVRAAAAREPTRIEPASRQPAAIENAWPLQPVSEPSPPPPIAMPAPPTPPSRSYRSAPPEEPWMAPEPAPRSRAADSSSLTGLAAELSSRLHPPEPTVRNEPPVRASAPPPPPPPVMTAEPEAPQTDHNLAEMAQQLEAALRRSPMPEPRPPVTDPLGIPAAQTQGAPTPAAYVTAEPPARAPMRDFKPRLEPRFDGKPEAEPKTEPRAAPRLEPRLDSKFENRPEPAGKTVYDSLEEEMANLLGRPPGKT